MGIERAHRGLVGAPPISTACPFAETRCTIDALIDEVDFDSVLDRIGSRDRLTSECCHRSFSSEFPAFSATAFRRGATATGKAGRYTVFAAFAGLACLHIWHDHKAGQARLTPREQLLRAISRRYRSRLQQTRLTF